MKKVRIDSFNKSIGEQAALPKEIDWTNQSDRRWLQNHLHWAMHHGVTVSITPDFKPN